MDIEALKRRINPFGQRSLAIGGSITVRLTLFCFDSTALLILIITAFLFIESKPVNQEVIHTVILPPRCGVCSLICPYSYILIFFVGWCNSVGHSFSLYFPLFKSVDSKLVNNGQWLWRSWQSGRFQYQRTQV